MQRKIPSAFFILFGVSLAIMAAPVNAWAGTAAPRFVQAAAIGSQFEISSSRLALQNSQNDDVKQFAQQMVDDHTQMSNLLKTTIASSDAKVPMPNPALDPKHRKLVNKLDGLSGNDFDKLYVSEQVKAHDETVELFRDYAKNGDNDALKGFATQMLPVLEEHKKHAHSLESSL